MRLDTATTSETTTITEPMGFDPESAAVLADILSGLYTNPYEAVVREYAANGIDAHQNAGETRPVEVTLPEHFNPQLVIRDYGTGMSTDGAKGLFGTYGASDKRSTNDVIGGYGIGSKSAFAIADVLTVETIKDGTLTRLTAMRTEDGPSITGAHTESTDAPSGTTVTVPVDPLQGWYRHAQRALAFTAGAVTIDGVTPVDPRGEAPEGGHSTVAAMIPATGGLSLFDSEPRVVMGGMSYAIPESIKKEMSKVITGAVAVIEAPIGTVRLSPSRESILDTKANAELLVDYIHTTWLDETESKTLGKTPWHTLYQHLHHGGSRVVPSSVSEHLSRLADETRYRDTSYATVTVGADSKRVSSNHSTFGSASQDIRATDQKRQVFVPRSVKSSPKLRRWLWDHSGPNPDSSHDTALAVIAPEEDLNTIAEAGFTVMSGEELSAYKPSRVLLRAPKSQIFYPVTDTGGVTEWLAPDDIRQKFTRIVFGREYSSGSRVAGYGSADADLMVCKKVYGDDIGIVQVSERQSQGTAEERIGAECLSMMEARKSWATEQLDQLSEADRQMLLILCDGFVRITKFGHITSAARRQIGDRKDALTLTRTIAEEHNLQLPEGFSKAEQLVDLLGDENLLGDLRDKLIAEGQDPDAWLAAVTPILRTVVDDHPIWPREVERFIREVRTGSWNGSHRQRAHILGYLMIGEW